MISDMPSRHCNSDLQLRPSHGMPYIRETTSRQTAMPGLAASTSCFYSRLFALTCRDGPAHNNGKLELFYLNQRPSRRLLARRAQVTSSGTYAKGSTNLPHERSAVCHSQTPKAYKVYMPWLTNMKILFSLDPVFV